MNCVKLEPTEINRRLELLFEQQKEFLFNDPDNATLVRSVIFVAGPLGVDSPPFIDFERSSGSVNNQQATEGYAVLAEDFLQNAFSFLDVKDYGLRRAFGRRNFETGEDDSTLKIRFGSPLIENLELQEVLVVDQLLSAGSYILVLLLVATYIKSFILAFVSMTGVLFSLIVALVLYAGVLRIDYFTPLNILVLFLIAGVGADNVLVMVDAWRQSELDVKVDIGLSMKPSDFITLDLQRRFLVNRLVYTMERSVSAVSNTSITTFVAFLATAISPIPAIAGLGIFAALAILVNWWFMFTLHPANLMWHYYVMVKKIPPEILEPQKKSINSKRMSVSTAFRTVLNFERGVHDAALDSSARLSVAMRMQEERKNSIFEAGIEGGSVVPEDTGISFRTRNSMKSSMRPPGLGSIKVMTTKKQLNKAKGILGSLFNKYSYLVNNTPAPYVLVSFMLAFLLAQVILSSRLETPSNIESNFPPDHMFGEFLLDFGTKFPDIDGSGFVDVNIMIGVEDFDISGIKKLSGDKSGGIPILDPNFQFFSQENQDFIFELCGPLPEIRCNLEGCLERTLFRENDQRKNCELDSFLKKVIAGSNFTSIVVGDPGGPPNEETFNQLVLEFGVSDRLGADENGALFIIVRNQISLARFQPLKIKEPVLDLLQDELDKLIERAPNGLKSIRLSVEENVLLVTELSLISGLFEGLAISLVASFFVLLIGTGSSRLAIFAVFSVAGVAVSVLGTIQLQGGQLGTAESIAGVFVIGLSIDYIVHLAHMFDHSEKFLDGRENPNHESRRFYHRVFKKDRQFVFLRSEKVHLTLTKMGPTVLAGGLTTLCSALFLSLCTFAFFGKMSNMLLLTVVYALMSSFFLFIPLLRIMGPGEAG